MLFPIKLSISFSFVLWNLFQELGTEFGTSLEGPHVVDMKRQVGLECIFWTCAQELCLVC